MKSVSNHIASIKNNKLQNKMYMEKQNKMIGKKKQFFLI